MVLWGRFVCVVKWRYMSSAALDMDQFRQSCLPRIDGIVVALSVACGFARAALI